MFGKFPEPQILGFLERVSKNVLGECMSKVGVQCEILLCFDDIIAIIFVSHAGKRIICHYPSARLAWSLRTRCSLQPARFSDRHRGLEAHYLDNHHHQPPPRS